MIYEFVIDLRSKRLLLRDLKLEKNFRILIKMVEMENYSLKRIMN